MASDPDRTARAIKKDPSVKSPKLELRMGEIKAVDVPKGKVDLTLGGATTPIPSVSHLSNYRPTVGDVVWVLVNGPDLLAVDRVPALGPSVIDDFVSDTILASETRTSTSYGDLATPGPTLPAMVTPSGRLLVQLSCFLSCSSSSGGAAMGFEMKRLSDGAIIPANDTRALYQLRAGANREIAASRIVMVTGLEPGEYEVTAKYRAVSTGTARFGGRWLWMLPL